MKMNDLKIGTQIKMGFYLILLLIVILGAVSWSQSTRLAQQTTNLYEHPLTVVTALSKLKVDVLVMQRGMKELSLVKSDTEFSKTLQDIDVHKAHALKQFDVLYAQYLGSRADVDHAYNCFVEWNTICGEAIRSGKVREAMDRTMSGRAEGRHVELLLGKIRKIEDFAKRKGDIFYSNAVEQNKIMKWQLLAWIAGIMALVLLLITTLMKNIRNPLDELNAVTQLFKDGKRNVRSNYLSSNEFGLLSASFNDLAGTIEAAMELNEKAVRLDQLMLSEEDAHRFCHSLLSALLQDTWSQVAALYLLNDEKTKFEPFECIGMNTSNCKPFSAVNYGGEFGNALSTRKIQHITHIPEDTLFTFAAVIGEFMPREIVTIPILSGDEVVAVMSLAKLKTFSENSLKLLNTILGTLNARMGGILAHRKIIAFSQKLEYQNIELETQKNELESQKNELESQKNELVEQNMELEMQKVQLDESNKLKTIFLSNMSHELRTPLNSVIALSGVLNRRLAGKVPEEEYSYLEVIERNGKNLLLLINDILDLSRIEAGREDIEINTFDVGALLREIVEMLEPQAKQKKVSLRYFSNNELPSINSDFEKIRHILQNIVGNAVKFTEKGSVDITVQVQKDTLGIVVSDTGIGIESSSIPHIFDEFRQADGSNSRKYGGTGLGLAIAKKYANMLGGSIGVESTYGKGSRFTLNLPLSLETPQAMMEISDNKHRVKVAIPEKQVGLVHTKDKTILLVEDTEAIVIQMKDMLETQGYNLIVAHNGSEALEQIAQKIPDGMILDLMMPEVDGFEVLKCIREKKITEHLPVIILTAKYVTKEELSFLKHNGIHQLIKKGDINKLQLLEAVASMVYHEPAETELPRKQPVPIPASDIPVVLVVEDNPDNMLTIKALLFGKCTVLEAEDGIIGIEMAKKHQPHLILMDIALPGVNGVEALRELRKDRSVSHIPVIAVSASAMKGDRENFMALGFDGYISKPIDEKLFTQVIDGWIKKEC
jgi:signal transduction histidine kinase/response regulator RpfG family c-di-GMP phosphodiesterase